VRGAAFACPALCTAQHLICFLDSYVTTISLLTDECGDNGRHREPLGPDTLIVVPPVIRFVHHDFGGTGVRLPGAFSLQANRDSDKCCSIRCAGAANLRPPTHARQHKAV
jgi:hypothetical protein